MPIQLVKRTTAGQSRMGALAAPAPPVTAQQPTSQPPTGKATTFTTADQNAMLQRQRAQMDGNSRQAINDYTNPAQQANGYALSQNMNHKLNTGQPLTAAEKKLQGELDKIMVPIGKETTLYRATHDNFLTRMGFDVNNYSTNAQLNKALTGVTWQEKGFQSTSHTASKNPFWPGGYMSGGREVLIKIHTGSGAKAALVQTSQAEVLLARGTNYRITGAKFTGGRAYPQKGGVKKIIEIDVEVW